MGNGPSLRHEGEGPVPPRPACYARERLRARARCAAWPDGDAGGAGAQLWPVNGYKWAATAASVVQDNNEADKPGTEKNVLMNYKFPNY